MKGVRNEKQSSLISIGHFCSSISRVNLKYQNYESKNVGILKDSNDQINYDTFYQPAVLLLNRMYEDNK